LIGEFGIFYHPVTQFCTVFTIVPLWLWVFHWWLRLMGQSLFHSAWLLEIIFFHPWTGVLVTRYCPATQSRGSNQYFKLASFIVFADVDIYTDCVFGVGDSAEFVMRICGAHKDVKNIVVFINRRGCYMTWHQFYSVLTKIEEFWQPRVGLRPDTLDKLFTAQDDPNLCAAMATSGYVELQFEVTIRLLSMAEVAGLLSIFLSSDPFFSHVVRLLRSSNVVVVRATAKLLTNLAESSRKTMILMGMTLISPSLVDILEGHCWTQDVTPGLGDTLALYACVSLIVTFVSITQEVAVAIVAAGSVVYVFALACFTCSILDFGPFLDFGGLLSTSFWEFRIFRLGHFHWLRLLFFR
jgi:hypothetical protein